MLAYVKLKSKRIDHCGVAPLKQDEENFTNPKDKAEILNKYFTSAFISEDTSTIPILDHNPPSISPVVIHYEGTINLLSNLKEHKAKGPDEIPTMLLKRLSREISPALTQIFKPLSINPKSLQSGKKPILFQSLKKVKEVMPVIVDQCRLSVCVCV